MAVDVTEPSAPAADRARYTTVAIILHWVIAAALIFQIILGWRAGDGPKGQTTFALMQLHKSIGVTILVLSLARIAWRLGHRPPPHPVGQPAWEVLASKIVHVGFYVIMIGLPLTGWLIVSTSKTGIPTVLFGAIPWPHLPGFADLAAGPKHLWHQVGELGHGLFVKTTYLLVLLHLGAVAKHQILDRDAVFGNMAVGAKPGWKEPRLWLAAAGLAAVVAAGYLYQPTIKVAAPAAPAPAERAATVEPASPPQASEVPVAAAIQSTEPVAWTVQKGGRLGFTASWDGAPIEGAFQRWDADILFSPDALDRSRLTVSVDLASASTGEAQRDATLAGEDFFDAAAHPKAIFTARTFRRTGEGRYVADGTLDLRGVRKPLSLPFSLKIDGDTATAQGVTSLDRTMFGVGQGEWASTDQIPAKVKISVSLTARRK
jgi:cytochrome b561/polyisoprenoid-binding protein YceI